jgi:hypothetical protein
MSYGICFDKCAAIVGNYRNNTTAARLHSLKLPVGLKSARVVFWILNVSVAFFVCLPVNHRYNGQLTYQEHRPLIKVDEAQGIIGV